MNLKGCRAGGTYSPQACRGIPARWRGHGKSAIGACMSLMSALGQERPIHAGLDESAMPPIATKSLHRGNRRVGPIGDLPV
jgi:hypothetical protein